MQITQKASRFVSDIVKLYHHWSIASESPFNPHPTPASVSGSHPFIHTYPFFDLCVSLEGRFWRMAPIFSLKDSVWALGLDYYRIAPCCSLVHSLYSSSQHTSVHYCQCALKTAGKNVIRLVKNGPTVTARRDAQLRHFTVMPGVGYIFNIGQIQCFLKYEVYWLYILFSTQPL